MPKKKPTPFQLIPAPLAGGIMGRNTARPSNKFLESRYDDEQRGQVRTFMAWSMAAGLAYAAGRTLPAPEFSEHTAACLKGVGRGLWDWEVVMPPDGSVPSGVSDLLAYLKEQALRPAAAFPADMRSLSPRLVVELLGGNYASVRRQVEGIAGYALSKNIHLDQVFGLMLYGDLQDKALPLLSRVRTQFDTLPGYGRKDTYLAEVISDGLEPFSVAILRHTLFEESLAQRLLNSRGVIEDKVRALYSALGAYLDEDFSRSFVTVMDRVLREEWHLDEFDPEDPEPDYEQVLERMIIWQHHDNRTLPAGLFLGLSLLSGVSPASLTAYAVSDARRRGYTYIAYDEMLTLADMVEESSMAGAAARCAKEIRGHAAELVDVQVGKQGVLERLAKVSRARTLEGMFWEFAGRLGGEK